MTDINNFISEIVKEKDRLDMPVFLNFLRGELDRKGIELTVNRSNDLRAVPAPLEMSNIIGVKLDLSEHDKEKDTEIEKYKKAFESAKCESDKAVCEYQNEIDRLRSRIQEFEESQEELPFEPIDAVQYLINRTIEVKNTFPKLQGGETSHVPVHDVSELRQIAEHILVYCKYHSEVE